MTPAPGERLQRFVGDYIRFALRNAGGALPAGWQARLRTNLGRAEELRREILDAHTHGLPLAGASWRDLPMRPNGEGWTLELPLTEPGFFKAKAYLIDPRGWQHWPEGPDFGVSVHPDRYRTANVLYCAFPRMFGPSRKAISTKDDTLARALAPLDEAGYTVIPPSGKLRDLTQQLPHIFDRLGCRILHLLPINPTPTTYARFGRFGSPYATQDLTGVDPALVVFDKRTNGIDQFRELTYATHLRGGRVFLDIVINHTGWGSVLQETHPEWFKRQPDGTFVSPGVWGVVWEDLVELRHRNIALWDELASVFITWCRRGVDGFRCDAGYMVPVPAWQYIVARVQQEYPETIFLLEGLGGAWEATDALLTEGGMQWAYSELFQNYSGLQVAGYLDHSFNKSRTVGLLVHYSETHDNERLAARSHAWSLLRNRLCALSSVSGAFGFTCGVEWLATEKIRVHGSTGMAWDNPENIVPELAKLNQLLTSHPCFFDGATVTRLSGADSPVYALQRDSEEELDTVLVVLNTDVEHAQSLVLEGQTVARLQAAAASADARATRSEGEKEPALATIAMGQGQGQTATLESADPLTEWVDLLGQRAPVMRESGADRLVLELPAGGAFCLAPSSTPRGLHGEAYRRRRAQAAWALSALSCVRSADEIPESDWRALAAEVDLSPFDFLATKAQPASFSAARAEVGRAVPSAPQRAPEAGGIAGAAHKSRGAGGAPGRSALPAEPSSTAFPRVVCWSLLDRRRITPIPPDHWLLLQDDAPFRAALNLHDGSPVENVESIAVRDGHIACFSPRQTPADATLLLERYAETDTQIEAALRFLPAEPLLAPRAPVATDMVLLTNGRGGMARLCVDLGRVNSKYDCVLGANLHPSLPVDRHILAKRIRVWITADGFISPLDFRSLESFHAGPPATWNFVANAGDGRVVQVQMMAEMLESRNTTVFRFTRPSAAQAAGKQLPADADVRLTVRLDLEDRNFHQQTQRNGGAEYHFASNLHPLEANFSAAGKTGFAFTPASDRQLRVFITSGEYHPQPEWSEHLPHPVEQSRAQVGSGDALSPGWFELPLPKGASTTLVVTAELIGPTPVELEHGVGMGRGIYAASGSEQPEALVFRQAPEASTVKRPEGRAPLEVPEAVTVETDPFAQQLERAARSFVVQRGTGKTVIAGYPWFLDWGRDTFICARGLLAAGMTEEVKQLLLTFARFEKDGTLPNTIFGEDASNRDTSDAPLWFGLVCEELAAQVGPIGHLPCAPGRTLFDVLESIALNYVNGTPNSIRMDALSGLVWSPSHFTWMDTNYPAATPRQGYPVEIQALWIRLLQQLQRIGGRTQRKAWGELAQRALASFEQLFWLENRGYYSDVLLAPPGQPAAQAVADDALRSNCLLAISLGLVRGARARSCAAAAVRYLVVPGALRTLAPLPVNVPLPIYRSDGQLLNDPMRPYWGRYEGDEDTRRKPAYHNGTAWTWTFPVFCEALARAWEFSPEAVSAAKAYLGSMARLLQEGCLGQLPEILDGDAPHTQRGCDAQAWGATEALRVWKLLKAGV